MKPHHRTRSSTTTVASDASASHRNMRGAKIANGIKHTSTPSGSNVQAQTTSDDSADDDAEDDNNGDGESSAEKAPSHELEGVHLDVEVESKERNDEDDNSGSEDEFDVPDDDDDYTGLDMISISSGDLDVRKQESTFIEQALNNDIAWADELQNNDPTNIDWTDAKTYEQLPSSGIYDDDLDSGFPGVDASSPYSYLPSNSPSAQLAQSHFQPFLEDRSLSRPLFNVGESDTERFFDETGTSSSDESSPRSAVQAEDDLASVSAGSAAGASLDDSDTEDEDLTAEIEERTRHLEQLKAQQRRRKQKHAPKTLKLRPKAGAGANVMKSFRINPNRPLALTVVTPRGSVLRIVEPRTDKHKIKWVTGRTNPEPVDQTPMSEAYAVAMQSTMFRLLHCPDSPSTRFGRRGGHSVFPNLGTNLMLTSPGMIPITPLPDRPFFELGEATDQDVTDFYLDLDYADEVDDDDAAPTPTPANFRKEAMDHFLQTIPKEFHMTPGEMADAAAASSTPTRRPRKRTIEAATELDEELASSPPKRPRSQRV